MSFPLVLRNGRGENAAAADKILLMITGRTFKEKILYEKTDGSTLKKW